MAQMITNAKPTIPAAKGFTLIELLVVVAMVAILASLASPSLREFASNQALKGVASDLQAAMNLAKNSAVSRNKQVIIAPLTGTDWATGWQVYEDSDASGSFDAAKDKVLSTREGIPDGVSRETVESGNCADVALIAFGPDGFLRKIGDNPISGGIQFKSNVTTYKRCVMVSQVGAARVCGVGGGALAC